MNTTDTTTTQIDQLRHVTAAVTALVKHATPDQLLRASPCAGWNGRDVLNHMVGGADWFAGPARAISIAGVSQAFRDAGFYGPEVAAPAGASAAQRLAAFTGRKDLSRRGTSGQGDMWPSRRQR